MLSFWSSDFCVISAKRKIKQLWVISMFASRPAAVQVTLPFVRVPRSGIKGKNSSLEICWKMDTPTQRVCLSAWNIMLCRPGHPCNVTSELLWLCLAPYWYTVWPVLGDFQVVEALKVLWLPLRRAQGSWTLQLPSHELPMADPRVTPEHMLEGGEWKAHLPPQRRGFRQQE